MASIYKDEALQEVPRTVEFHEIDPDGDLILEMTSKQPFEGRPRVSVNCFKSDAKI